MGFSTVGPGQPPSTVDMMEQGDGQVPRLLIGDLELRGVSFSLTTIDIEHELSPEEARYVTCAVEQRRREFAAGRACARRALAALGIAAGSLGRRRDRAPAWPEGTVGSISHCRHFACAVASRTLAGIGVDVECVGQIPRALQATLFTPKERLLLDEEVSDATLLFSAKEAAFKAVAPTLGVHIAFGDVEVRVDAKHSRFRTRFCGVGQDGRLIDRLCGAFAYTESHVFTIAFLSAASNRDGLQD
jgi:4'-phosphopantetheinyl transferase EntD